MVNLQDLTEIERECLARIVCTELAAGQRIQSISVGAIEIGKSLEAKGIFVQSKPLFAGDNRTNYELTTLGRAYLGGLAA
ncbi:MAG: hypothetical protein AABX11_05080 [Nanoarchaeota archaeon]